ncbi:hypothetical protein MyxoNM_09535 [Myxococcus xanthus]|nr:hypothetical protein MyxoNM_09535 [Myxococcus xanthus]SDY25962.1 hypothetical protein SAMN05444383_12828 [Myxococcus xanthus]
MDPGCDVEAGSEAGTAQAAAQVETSVLTQMEVRGTTGRWLVTAPHMRSQERNAPPLPDDTEETSLSVDSCAYPKLGRRVVGASPPHSAVRQCQ